MDQANQGNYSVSPTDAPVKRKRGRPRKDPNQNPGMLGRVPPGFARQNGNQSRGIEPNQDGRDVMVGQPVSGVIDATFDAGYLITLRIGNSDTTLRGVVFEPGRTVPLSAENDVAPNVPFIGRHPIPHHTENRIQVHGRSRRPRGPRGKYKKRANLHTTELSQFLNESQAPNMLNSRGSFVPVVLQPNLSNGSPPVFPAPHLASTVGKHAPLLLHAPHNSNGSIPNNQVPVMTNQVSPLPLPPHTSHQSVSPGAQIEGVFTSEAEAKPSQTDAPFQTLLGEVIKRGQSPSQTAEAQIKVPDTNEPLSVEPLQAVQPVPIQAAETSVEYGRPGKLTELLQVLQENMTQNQLPQVQQCDTSSTSSDEESNEDEGSDKFFPDSSV